MFITKKIQDELKKMRACRVPKIGTSIKKLPINHLKWFFENRNLSVFSEHTFRKSKHYLASKRVYINSKGLLHRINGPAVEYANGDKEWWINGKRQPSPTKIFLNN